MFSVAHPSTTVSATVSPSASSLLKKGTGSELTVANTAEDKGGEVPVPLSQQAAKQSLVA